MATTVKIRRSGTATATPSSLEHGEIAINYADGKVFWKDASNVITSFTFQSYALASHTHAASDITSGTLDIARIPTGSTSSTVCIGDDARLSDTRTPTDGTVSTAKLADDAVTYAKLQNVSTTDRLLGRSTAGAGVVEEITCTAFGRSLIDDADAAAARTTLGVQPTASPAFTGNATITASSGIPLTLNGNSTALRIEEGAGETIDIYRNVSDGLCYFDANQQTFSGFVFRTTPTGGSVTTRLTISSTGTATFAGQVLVTAGSGSSGSYKPGVAISGDDDTGVMQTTSGGANTLSLVTNGTERVRVDASGKLKIASTANFDGYFAVNNGTNKNIQLRGSIRLGGSSIQSIQDNAASDSALEIFCGGAQLQLEGNPISFYNSGEAARITSDGYLLVGYTTSNGAYKLQVNSQIYATNATVATSDARFKTNVESLTDATSVIESLRPVAFDFIPQEDRNFATERQVGLIAQETQAALAGTDYADSVVAQCGDHLGLAYEKLVPVLIKALQESNARIAALEERLNHG